MALAWVDMPDIDEIEDSAEAHASPRPPARCGWIHEWIHAATPEPHDDLRDFTRYIDAASGMSRQLIASGRAAEFSPHYFRVRELLEEIIRQVERYERQFKIQISAQAAEETLAQCLWTLRSLPDERHHDPLLSPGDTVTVDWRTINREANSMANRPRFDEDGVRIVFHTDIHSEAPIPESEEPDDPYVR